MFDSFNALQLSLEHGLIVFVLGLIELGVIIE